MRPLDQAACEDDQTWQHQKRVAAMKSSCSEPTVGANKLGRDNSELGELVQEI